MNRQSENNNCQERALGIRGFVRRSRATKRSVAAVGRGTAIRSDAGMRKGFSLLELMLALALIVMATAIIGSLLQMYSRNFATRGEDIRRKQLARALLNMIAEDIRAVVLEQEYDTSVLEQQLGADRQTAY